MEETPVLENENTEQINIQYELPKFHHRILANMIDLVIFFLLAVALFIPTNAIMTHTPKYVSSNNLVNQYRLESGLYRYEDKTKTYITWPTYYDNYAEADAYVKVTQCDKSINDFIAFIDKKLGSEESLKMQNNYDTYRLSLKFEGEPYFIKDDEGHVISNKLSNGGTCQANNEQYYKNVYRMYIIQDCGGYLISLFPEYYSATKFMSNMLFYVEIPVAYSLGAILTYFVPPLIFRRGRKTIGKLIYRVGLVDPRFLSPTFPRFLLRFLILFLGELILGFFTFGIPFIISFSMMAFSKRKQGFPDYVCGLIEVNTNLENIYFNKYEIAILRTEERKKGITFHMKSRL